MKLRERLKIHRTTVVYCRWAGRVGGVGMDITYMALTIALLCFAAISAVLVINQTGGTKNNGRATKGDRGWLKSALVRPTAKVAVKKTSLTRPTQAVERRKSFVLKSNKVSDVRKPWGW